MEPSKNFMHTLRQYPECYQAILGNNMINWAQVKGIIELLKLGTLYAGSDGSVKYGCGTHAYGFTSGITSGRIWGGTPLPLGQRKR